MKYLISDAFIKNIFTVENQKITIKSTKDSSSNNLKSPDDEPHLAVSMQTVVIGYSTHLSETVHPDNKINFITDIVVVKNNVSDDKILEKRIPIKKQLRLY